METRRPDLPIPANHARLVTSAYGLFKLLGHRIVRTQHVAPHETLLSVTSATGETWFAKCDSNHELTSDSVHALLASASAEMPRRIAVFTSGFVSDEIRTLSSSLAVEVIDNQALANLLSRAAQSSSAADDPSAHPPPETSTPAPPPPPAAPQHLPALVRCPYCAEDIRAEARICKHCGREVTLGPQSLTDNRASLQQRLVQLETDLIKWESYLQQQGLEASKAGDITSRVVWILVGVLLAPIGIGLIIIALALVDILARHSKRSGAHANQARANTEIASIRAQIISTRAELASL